MLIYKKIYKYLIFIKTLFNCATYCQQGFCFYMFSAQETQIKPMAIQQANWQAASISQVYLSVCLSHRTNMLWGLCLYPSIGPFLKTTTLYFINTHSLGKPNVVELGHMNTTTSEFRYFGLSKLPVLYPQCVNIFHLSSP